MGRQSLRKRATQEANRHRWLESEKAGRDLGDEAVREWSRRYWLPFCRHRWVEHLEGKTFWEEFGEELFGLLERGRFRAPRELVHKIVDKFRQGSENLDVIVWALEQGHDVAAVAEVLERLDINTQRESWMSL